MEIVARLHECRRCAQHGRGESKSPGPARNEIKEIVRLERKDCQKYPLQIFCKVGTMVTRGRSDLLALGTRLPDGQGHNNNNNNNNNKLYLHDHK